MYPTQRKTYEFRITPISSKHFTRSGDTLVCEASDLGPEQRKYCMQRFYQDACDEGLAVVSERTGREVRFAFHSHDLNGDEIAGYRYHAIDDACGIKQVLIIND